MQDWFFVGGGNMAAAILGGYLDRYPGRQPCVVDPSSNARARMSDLGCTVYSSLSPERKLDTCVLAVKPQVFPRIASGVEEALGKDPLIVSIMVGVPSSTIADAVGTDRIVRVMPNTPMMIGEGVSGVAGCGSATEGDVDRVCELFGASGKVLRVDEEGIDRVAAVSGSGPAYLYRFCEAFVGAAIRSVGFDEDAAKDLVASTLKGSLAYAMSEDGFPVSRLRREVTSPGGTTEAALRVMNNAGLDTIFEEALQAALDRAEELKKGEVG